MMETVIKVTPEEAAHADWAIGGMQDVAGTEDFDYEEKDLPFMRGPGKYGNELAFPTSSANAAGDFLWRVEDQLKDMIYDEYGYGDAFHPKLEPKGAAALRSSKSLARKVRARFPNTTENPLDDSSVLLIGAGVVLLGALGYFVYRQQSSNPLLSVAAG